LVVFHQHAGRYGLGKSEPAGLAGDPMHHTGARLAEQGFVVLCADALCFEERQRGHPALPAALEPNGDGGEYERIEFLRYVVDGKSMVPPGGRRGPHGVLRALDGLHARLAESR
jgi:dienelactone hydrolase